MTETNGTKRPGRILFAGDLRKRRHTSFYILKALKEMGFSVDPVDLSRPEAGRRKLSRLAAGREYLCFIAVKGEGLDPSAVAGLSAAMPTILWYPDFIMFDWLARLIPSFRFFFSVSRDFQDEARRLFPSVSCGWLAQGPRFHEFKAPLRKKKISDLALIGNLAGEYYAERRRMLSGLVKSGNYDLKIWGPPLDRSMMTDEEYSLLLPYHAGRAVYGRRFKDVVLNSSIVIGHDSVWNQAGCTSAKTFMVLGCGGFYLTRKGGFEKEIFRSGEELETYETLGELREKIAYFLVHGDERRRIAEKGRSTVLSRYTYDRRMGEMLEAAGVLQEKKNGSKESA